MILKSQEILDNKLLKMKDLEGKRLNELEARATFQEDTIEKLSKELSIQQKEIILLKEEIKSLKESFEKNIIEDTAEKPPHY